MTDPSPLLSASPDSISALFEADPVSLSDADLSSLISELRRRRNVFTAEEAAQASKGKKAKPPASPTTPLAADKPTGELDLEDLA